MSVARSILGTLIEPISAFRALLSAPRSLVVLIFLCAAQLTLAWALAGKVSASREVAAQLQQSGKLKSMSDRELREATTQAEKLHAAGRFALALVGPPLLALALAIALWLWARVLGAAPKLGPLFALCAHAQLPLGIRSLASALAAHAQLHVDPADVSHLLPAGLGPLVHPAQPAWAHLADGVDFFRLWTAVLLGVALYVSGRFSARRAAIGMGLAYAAYLLVFFVGLPGLAGA